MGYLPLLSDETHFDALHKKMWSPLRLSFRQSWLLEAALSADQPKIVLNNKDNVTVRIYKPILCQEYSPSGDLFVDRLGAGEVILKYRISIQNFLWVFLLWRTVSPSGNVLLLGAGGLWVTVLIVDLWQLKRRRITFSIALLILEYDYNDLLISLKDSKGFSVIITSIKLLHSFV